MSVLRAQPFESGRLAVDFSFSLYRSSGVLSNSSPVQSAVAVPGLAARSPAELASVKVVPPANRDSSRVLRQSGLSGTALGTGGVSPCRGRFHPHHGAGSAGRCLLGGVCWAFPWTPSCSLSAEICLLHGCRLVRCFSALAEVTAGTLCQRVSRRRDVLASQSGPVVFPCRWVCRCL